MRAMYQKHLLRMQPENQTRIVDLERIIQDQNRKILEKDSLISKFYSANQALGIALEKSLTRANRYSANF